MLALGVDVKVTNWYFLMIFCCCRYCCYVINEVWNGRVWVAVYACDVYVCVLLSKAVVVSIVLVCV